MRQRHRAVLGALLVLVAVGTTPAHAQGGPTIEVQPAVRWSLVDGGTRVEPGGAWTLAMPDVDSPIEEDGGKGAIHHVILLVDTSGSMPQSHDGTGGFGSVVTAVTERAREVLAPFVGTRDMRLSLYRFDDLARVDGQWRPDVELVKQDLSVASALAELETFIPRDPASYDGEYTYIAASVFEAARRELGLSDDPKERLSDEAGPLTVFVFTDVGERNGGENPDRSRDFDGAAYSAWLDDHIDSNQLDYVHWDIVTDDGITPLQPEQGVMRIQWAHPGRADGWTTRAGPASVRREFQVHPWVRLVPGITEPVDSDGVVCPPRVDETGTSAPREIIRLQWVRPLVYVLGDLSDVAVGRHDVLLDRETLCDGLTQAWPNVTFVLPSHDGEPAPLAWVEVADPDVHVLDLVAAGTVADASLGRLAADRLHRWESVERTFTLTTDEAEGLQVDVAWSVRVRRSGQPLAQADDLVRLLGPSSDSLSQSTAANVPVTLHIPGRAQHILPFSRSVRHPPGEYEIEVCAKPQVLGVPRTDSIVELECAGCAPTAVQQDHSAICVTPTVTLGALPLSWWWLGLSVLGIAVTVSSLGWYWAANPFTGQTVGRPAAALADMVRRDRVQHFAWRWFRRPYLIRLPDLTGTAEVSGVYVGRRLRRDTLYGTYVGVAPAGDGLKLWPVVVNRRRAPTEGAADEPAEESWITIAGHRLAVALDSHGRPLETDDTTKHYRVVGLDALMRGDAEICLHIKKGEVETVRCVPLGWRSVKRKKRPPSSAPRARGAAGRGPTTRSGSTTWRRRR